MPGYYLKKSLASPLLPGANPPQAQLDPASAAGPGIGGAATAAGVAASVPPDVGPTQTPAAPAPVQGVPETQPMSMSWQPGVTGSVVYPDGQGPVTGQVPSLAEMFSAGSGIPGATTPQDMAMAKLSRDCRVRKPYSKTVRSGKFSSGRWLPSHRFQGSTTKRASVVGGLTSLAGLGGLLGAPVGAVQGFRKGNVAEGLGRGAIRGGLTGAGAGLGILTGHALGSYLSPQNPSVANWGANLGLLGGGLAGFLGSGRLLGPAGYSGKRPGRRGLTDAEEQELAELEQWQLITPSLDEEKLQRLRALHEKLRSHYEKRSSLERSAVGESGLTLRERPWSLQGSAAWPSVEELRSNSRRRSREPSSQRRSKMAEGFLRRCRELGLTESQTQAAIVKAAMANPQVAADFYGWEKAAAGRLSLLQALSKYGPRWLRPAAKGVRLSRLRRPGGFRLARRFRRRMELPSPAPHPTGRAWSASELAAEFGARPMRSGIETVTAAGGKGVRDVGSGTATVAARAPKPGVSQVGVGAATARSSPAAAGSGTVTVGQGPAAAGSSSTVVGAGVPRPNVNVGAESIGVGVGTPVTVSSGSRVGRGVAGVSRQAPARGVQQTTVHPQFSGPGAQTTVTGANAPSSLVQSVTAGPAVSTTGRGASGLSFQQTVGTAPRSTGLFTESVATRTAANLGSRAAKAFGSEAVGVGESIRFPRIPRQAVQQRYMSMFGATPAEARVARMFNRVGTRPGRWAKNRWWRVRDSRPGRTVAQSGPARLASRGIQEYRQGTGWLPTMARSTVGQGLGGLLFGAGADVLLANPEEGSRWLAPFRYGSLAHRLGLAGLAIGPFVGSARYLGSRFMPSWVGAVGPRLPAWARRGASFAGGSLALGAGYGLVEPWVHRTIDAVGYLPGAHAAQEFEKRTGISFNELFVESPDKPGSYNLNPELIPSLAATVFSDPRASQWLTQILEEMSPETRGQLAQHLASPELFKEVIVAASESPESTEKLISALEALPPEISEAIGNMLQKPDAKPLRDRLLNLALPEPLKATLTRLGLANEAGEVDADLTVQYVQSGLDKLQATSKWAEVMNNPYVGPLVSSFLQASPLQQLLLAGGLLLGLVSLIRGSGTGSLMGLLMAGAGLLAPSLLGGSPAMEDTQAAKNDDKNEQVAGEVAQTSRSETSGE